MQSLRTNHAGRAGREVNVLDMLLLVATAAFFLLSLAFVRGCERL